MNLFLRGPLAAFAGKTPPDTTAKGASESYWSSSAASGGGNLVDHTERRSLQRTILEDWFSPLNEMLFKALRKLLSIGLLADASVDISRRRSNYF